ncbi:Chloroplast stem-loop binding protein of 41 kDa b, chloroplastic [Porphyridium purpureum]|uniref:UDP-glucose 4-epimerase n=1 Tax=Porphyridium purpureum TaxID=35688 RepID=A0A5J4YKX7_PORPP|nr:Chloroplast stem-loop binding protein of 41 kDa b, chloroplastic [Porphyridium purpureum]|eukprot:POR0216..scf244_11
MVAAFVGSVGGHAPRVTSPAGRAPARGISTQRRPQVVMMAAGDKKRVLVIGGTRFSGLYLTKVLADAGHEVVLFNRGSKPVGDKSLMVPGETQAQFEARNKNTSVIVGDRTDAAQMTELLKGETFDAIFDNNGRELADSKPLIDLFNGKIEQYIYMSSAGVYAKSDIMPHLETDAVDLKSRHKGKLDTETFLKQSGMPYTAIRPTYIYGALNYNPLEQWFFERLAAGRPVPVPGHGQHLTGLGHVMDLAKAMSACLGNPKAIGKVYNIQDEQAITFDGMVKACATAMGLDPDAVEIVHYNPKEFDFGKKKAFPCRPVHFFTSPRNALSDLDWTVEYNIQAGLKDSYSNDFVHKQKAGKLKNDFSTDDMVLEKLMALK